jgi:hypothetical protein
MTFNLKGWKRIAPLGTVSTGAGSTKSLYVYHAPTADTLAVIEGTGYFNALIKDLAVGDIIMVLSDYGGTPQRRDYFVNSVTTNVGLTKDARDLADNTTGTAGSTLAAGVGRYVLPFFINLADIASGDLLTNYLIGHRFKLLSFDFRVSKPATTGAKAATLNLEIGSPGTDVTGGVIALTSANCTPQGVAVAGTAITAANVGLATDVMSIEASAVTAFIEGNGWMLIGIQNMDVADAVASLNAN